MQTMKEVGIRPGSILKVRFIGEDSDSLPAKD